jgi:hypothetical protein
MVLAGTWLALGSACQRTPSAVYDGFESPALSSLWETRRFIPGAVRIQSSVARAGRSAARITLRPGDQIPQEKGTSLERAELQEARALWVREDSGAVYSFSLFLPQDFPLLSTRLVIGQWKQNCPVESCAPDNPVIAVRYQNGELTVTKRTGAEMETLYRTRAEIRNRWLDFTFLVRFSRNGDGRIRASLGGTTIVDYRGVTAYPEAGGYSRPAEFYFKTGLYRDRAPETMTIYLDEYRKEALPAGAR